MIWRCLRFFINPLPHLLLSSLHCHLHGHPRFSCPLQPPHLPARAIHHSPCPLHTHTHTHTHTHASPRSLLSKKPDALFCLVDVFSLSCAVPNFSCSTVLP